ncbi:MAG: SlyX-like protein [Pseudomonadota bacterium]
MSAANDLTRTIGDLLVRVEELETKAAFQEDTIRELNDALVGQQARIDQLENILRRLLDEVRGLMETGSPVTEEPPPPHY